MAARARASIAAASSVSSGVIVLVAMFVYGSPDYRRFTAAARPVTVTARLQHRPHELRWYRSRAGEAGGTGGYLPFTCISCLRAGPSASARFMIHRATTRPRRNWSGDD